MAVHVGSASNVGGAPPRHGHALRESAAVNGYFAPQSPSTTTLGAVEHLAPHLYYEVAVDIDKIRVEGIRIQVEAIRVCPRSGAIAFRRRDEGDWRLMLCEQKVRAILQTFNDFTVDGVLRRQVGDVGEGEGEPVTVRQLMAEYGRQRA